MNLSEDVDLEEFVMTKDDLSGADIKAVCTEAGLLALRERRMRVTKVDFVTARERVSSLMLVILGSLCLLMHVYYLGTVQKERGYTGRPIPLNLCILSLHFTSRFHSLIAIIFLFPSSLGTAPVQVSLPQVPMTLEISYLRSDLILRDRL